MAIVNKLKDSADVATPPSGYKTLFIRSDNGVPALKDSDGNVANLTLGGDASGVTYTPEDPLNWTDSVDPGSVADALDDLASRTNQLESEGVPDASQIPYTPANSIHWTDSEDPGEVNEALDDLASRVQALEEDSGGEAGLSDGDYGDITVSGVGTVMNIDAGVVGPTELANTAVSPGSYTLASITVDQQGRLTAASNGSVDASQVGFTPTNSIHWTDSEDPGDVDDALNDLAARVQALEENPVGSGDGSAGLHMIWIPAGAITPSVTGGCQSLTTIASAANQPDIQTLNFDATTQEYAQFSVGMPESWNEGTVTFAPVWSHPSTTTNFGVVFDLQAVAVSNDDTILANFGTAQTSTDTGGTTDDIYIGPTSSAITVAGTPAAGDMVFFRLSRVTGNGSDTMAVDARLHGIRLYITTDASTD